MDHTQSQATHPNPGAEPSIRTQDDSVASIPGKGPVTQNVSPLMSARCDSMRTGDIFICRIDGRIWEIVGWHLDQHECPIVVSVDALRERNLFAGCATPYGPFATTEDALAAQRSLIAPERAK